MAGKNVQQKLALRVGWAGPTASEEACILRKKGSLKRWSENIILKIGEWMNNRMLSVAEVRYLENMFKTNVQSPGEKHGWSEVRTQMCQLQGCWNFPG